MIVEIDFNSSEALYLQLKNQIVMEIATSRLRNGDSLPSVRQMAAMAGINMHTVNKAYAVLREEGFLTLDRVRGTVICLDMDKMKAVEEMRKSLSLLCARASCKNISKTEMHELIDEIYEEYE